MGKLTNVLWLDDQIEFLTSAVAKIAESDFSVTTAQTPIEAVRKIQSGGVDIALVDVQLKGRDFQSWYHFIETVQIFSGDTRFLIVTSHSDLPGSPGSRVEDIEVVKKDEFVKDPESFLTPLVSVEPEKKERRVSKVEDYKETIPSDIPKLFSHSPSWEIYNRLAKSPILRILTGFPVLILIYATLAKVPAILAGGNGIPPIVPITVGYVFLAIAFIHIVWKCPTIVAENRDGVHFQEKIYHGYLSDAQTKADIDSASKHIEGKADHWRIRYYFNKANFSLAGQRTVLALVLALGFSLVMWPSFMNVRTIWTNDVVPWWQQDRSIAE